MRQPDRMRKAAVVLCVGVVSLMVTASQVHARPEVAKLTPSDNPGGGSGFGAAVAMSGDYIAVGAPGDDTVADRNGSVYLFRRQGLGWVEQVKLIASDASRWRGFGAELAMEGDRLVVGAPGSIDAPLV